MTVDELVYKGLLAVQGCKYLYEAHLDGVLAHVSHGQVVTPAVAAEAKEKLRVALKRHWTPLGIAT